MDAEPTPIIVIVGTTASGKSRLAMKLAERFNGEIIAADSWTVYKQFDIGTAKPTKADRQKIKHHLIDVTTTKQGFSAAVFKKMALKAIADISSRDRLPIIVGGSGLYIDSLIFNYSFLPAHEINKRARLNSMTLDELLDVANQEGYNLSGVDQSNKRRIIRLIENKGQTPTKQEARANTLILGTVVNGDELNIKIMKRINQMFNKGLEQEVNKLRELFSWDVEPMKGIGYREWHAYFEGTQNLDETKEKITSSTRKLVKKQNTWFKRNKSIHWVSDQGQAVDLVTTFLDK